MRVSPARCAFVALTMVGLAGCSSGGGWSLQRLAFWKSNPFKSSSSATESGVPMRPSALASRTALPGTNSGYPASSSLAPSYPETATGTSGGYPATQQSYPSYPSAPPSGYSLSAPSNSGYMAPQTGAYGAGGAAGPARASSYVTPSPYSGMAASPYGSLANSRETTGGSRYTPANTTGSYAGSQSGGGADYADRADRYGSRLDRSGNGLDDRYAGGSDRYAGGYDNYSSGADRYASGAQSSTTPLTGADNRGDQYGSNAAAGAYRGSTTPPYTGGSQYSEVSPYDPRGSNSMAGQGAVSTAGNGYSPSSAASQQGGYPLAPNAAATNPTRSYNAPAAGYTPGGSGYTPGATGYTPGETDYSPGATDFTPPGVDRYQSPAGSYSSPAGSYTSPASTSDDPPPYRPGSTSDYMPRTPSAATSGANSSTYPSTVPDAGASATPTGYSQPLRSPR